MRREPKRKSNATAIASEIQRGIQMLDKPQATNPRKINDGHAHEFIMRDRCYWCGVPDQAQQPIEKAVPMGDDDDEQT